MRHGGGRHKGHRFEDNDRCEDRHAAGRGGWRGRHGHRRGFGGRHGMDGDDLRAGRMLAQGDLRLIALALIAEQPRHGYEIIKVLEEKTEGWYSPSPGIVYPTLTYLEEAGYVTAQADGAKKLYTITGEGQLHLDANRAFVDAVLERLKAAGERFGAMQRRAEGEDDERRGPRSKLVRAAMENLRDVVIEKLKNDPDAEAKLVEVLARAAQELRKQ
ncbi:MAG: PadR family transcriptional regulator [Pseudomonadota bacterium]